MPLMTLVASAVFLPARNVTRVAVMFFCLWIWKSIRLFRLARCPGAVCMLLLLHVAPGVYAVPLGNRGPGHWWKEMEGNGGFGLVRWRQRRRKSCGSCVRAP